MKELILKVGNDNGNSEQDITINGEQICQPNVLAKVRHLPMLDEVNPEFVINNIHSNLIVTVDSNSATLGHYFIGEYALHSGQRVRNIEVGVDNNKVDSEIVIINTLAHIAGFAVKEAYKKNKALDKEINVKVDMSTALPISQYGREIAQRFADKFSGEHLVTVHVGTTKVKVKINFDFIKVIPEGVTSTWYLKNADDELFEEYNQKNDEKLDKSYFEDRKVLHIAIGEGTTEYPITEGIKFDPNFIKGSNNGIGHAIDNALEEFKRGLGLASYSRQKYSEVLRDEAHKYYTEASDIVQDYIEDQAEEILFNAKGEIQRANNEVDIIIVYGGGSILMRDNLEKKLLAYCERANIKLLYVSEKYAVTLESKGLYEFVISNIFSALKEKNQNN